jgi:hypothetical protein
VAGTPPTVGRIRFYTQHLPATDLVFVIVGEATTIESSQHYFIKKELHGSLKWHDFTASP